ncbi:L-histidine N(alpha)-methyltransferase [Noviherbaspirillum pedocola]|uniref:L-histidine N(alpha)-methyltransferase n=1 Tax=Noviherbaspirillum pedocola TaxID=2801341 RepID=UPI001F473D37|nr:L-histidine N(alpha)-methyltransferase [Noviherbaspirillum pedocola]
MADFLERADSGSQGIIDELTQGLLARQATISPKYLYDPLGSRLFEAICELPEYYPTRTEAAIFDAHGADIAEAVGHGATLIDLGAGNCAKAARLFPLLKPAQYVPIDISADFLRGAVDSLQRRFPDIAMTALGMDFSSSLVLPDAVRRERRLFFYPGSSIGNFDPETALSFLRRLREANGDLLIGVDLIKDKAVLDAAYDDALGVTAAFNLNLLNHLNALLGADFQLREWRHRGFFHAERSRVEMHLEARRDIVVRWRGGERRFAEGERIHTENSYKYSADGFCDLLRQAGFEPAQRWTDERNPFLVCHARRD